MEKKEYLYQSPGEYNEAIKKSIPFYTFLIEGILDYIRIFQHQPIRALDIGCGTGNLAKSLLSLFPQATIDCLDFSEEMLVIAEQQLQPYTGRYTLLHQDIRTFDLDGSYDTIVSNLAFHHIEGMQAKRAFYKRLFDLLEPNGILVFGDLVKGANSYLNDLYEAKWIDFEISSGKNEKDVLEHHNKMKLVDFPSPFIEQIDALRSVGFKNVDCIFKYYGVAVIGGTK